MFGTFVILVLLGSGDTCGRRVRGLGMTRTVVLPRRERRRRPRARQIFNRRDGAWRSRRSFGETTYDIQLGSRAASLSGARAWRGGLCAGVARLGSTVPLRVL
ncbi:uncharacterized protein V1510DRAFT_219004 [Dipodascopsis tothii]|uniref:uncharacterized protein n=1 Tax=Dipodascopsis tothii TaxID=44089 RepID=UPI0034CE5C94